MGLEIPTAKVPGTEIRRTPAQRPAFIGLLIVALTGIIFLMTGLVMYAVFVEGANSASGHDPAIPKGSFDIPPGPDQVVPPFRTIEFFTSEQTIISFWLSIIFFSLFYLVFLYQRFFTDHVTIAKKRFRKWEDEGVQLHD